jgi:hypothetical protein
MILEVIGTWIVVGFFSAIGWGTAQKTVVEPYINPAFETNVQKIEKPNEQTTIQSKN